MTHLPVVQPPLQTVVAGGCEQCVFLRPCGGYRDFSLWNCFQRFCCHGKDGCDEVCPNNERFVERLNAVGGLRFDNLGTIEQRHLAMPLYVPHLNHRYSRDYPLRWPIVAITPYELFRLRSGSYTAQATNAVELRRQFHLANDTRVILRGTETDKPLERYWEHRLADGAPQQIAQLGIDLVIGPNFSHFNDVPRTDNVYNRKRQLICLEELHAAGLNVAPHLSDAVSADWDFWRSYLHDNPSITFVAKEFQTGNKRTAIAVEVLNRIEEIQQHLGRPLHPIMIGGAKLTEYAASRFLSFTVLDSRPFMESVNRQSFQPRGRRCVWQSEQTLPHFGIDDLLFDNINGYALWLSSRAKAKGNLKHLRSRRTA